MKKLLHILALAAVVAMPFSMTSCEDHPWDEYDKWGWVDNYDSWGWDNNYDDQYDSNNSTLVQMVQTLCGGWTGTMTYSEVLDNGTRENSQFYTDMEFYQYGTSANSLSGHGVEYDYTLDDNGNIKEDQTLRFTWYLDERTSDIYIKYTNSGMIFVLDAGSSQYGFHLGYEQGYTNDTFYGYMIGTNSDDVAYIDLERINTTGNMKAANGKTVTKSKATFGPAATRTSIINGGQQRLLKR